MKKIIAETLVWIVIIILISPITVIIFKSISDQDEINECHEWQYQAASYPLFYITSWQKMECDSHEIMINAPVK